MHFREETDQTIKSPHPQVNSVKTLPPIIDTPKFGMSEVTPPQNRIFLAPSLLIGYKGYPSSP